MNINNENEQSIKYISTSKKNIDKCMRRQDYKRAFRLLILVLERLDDTEKKDFIDYYSKNMLEIDSW